MNIRLEHIAKEYKNKDVLKDISIEIEAGSCLGILGGNGCGKSTLLSILAGIRKADSGRFLYEGHDMLKDKRLHSKVIGYVPQGTPLIEELSAKDNLSIFYDKRLMEEELSNGTLKLLGIDEYLNVPVRKMSGGMKKRLTIGCAVANRPRVLLLDEPSAALDLICKQRINDYLRAYRKAGGIILLATHDEEELLLCDRWVILKKGYAQEYEYNGNAKELIRHF